MSIKLLSQRLEERGKYNQLFALISKVKLAKELAGVDTSYETKLLKEISTKIGSRTTTSINPQHIKLLSQRFEEKGKAIQIKRILEWFCERFCPTYEYTCDKLPNVLYQLTDKYSKCFNPQPKVIDWQTLENLHIQKFGKDVYPIMYDGRYLIPKQEAMIDFIKKDWLNRKNYVSEFFDCDDYARVFKAHVIEFLKVNAIGFAIGEVRDVTTNRLLGYHAWNILVVWKDNKISFLFYEPQTDEVSESGIIGNWKYIPWVVEY